MMAYDSQFVLCVLHKGQPVREINNTVSLPYNSNYKVRLKNKHFNLRTKAKVWIDGRAVSNLGDFILKPNETLDLERFVDQSMASGNKFQFVPLSDGRVNDPTDSENGIIKVEFYREIVPITPKPSLVKPELTKGSRPFFAYNQGGSSWNYTPNRTFTTNTYTSGGGGSSLGNININYVSTEVYDSYSPQNGAGATVEGGHSGQSFVYADDFQTEAYPVTLELRIRGLRRGQWDDEFEHQPRPQKKMIKFCPNCGARRHRMANHFCHRCGTAYHPRYENERGRLVK